MIAVKDVAFVRYRAPDLDAMESFYVDFGMLVASRSDDALYLKGYGEAPFINVVERGSAACLGMGFYASSETDLQRLAESRNVPIENSPELGGGKRVRIQDPSGFLIDVVHGQQQSGEESARSAVELNSWGKRKRLGGTVRVTEGPAHIQRLGHVVLYCKDLKGSLDFYQDVLGFKISDAFYEGDQSNLHAVFMRCGLGEQWTDHHTIALVEAQDGEPRFGHSAFEVVDFDDLVQGGNLLKSKGYHHSWGVGRHILGSQLFDYWRDPCFNHVEHWTDGDLVNDSSPVNYEETGPNKMAQWGPEVGETFFSSGPKLGQ